MSVSFYRCCLLFILALSLTQVLGCSNRPVRNLASDVSLIQKGETTRQELLTLLGEPDSRRQLAENQEEWLYEEQIAARFQDLPYADRFFKSPGSQRIVVIVQGDQVLDTRYESQSRQDSSWQDDFDWQQTP
ncbi:MAG: hypothetical protein H8E79_05335 [Desulfobulbaceae bacterium]|uniref:Lipoprotein SmpA/OmlA domain-containing protein n=1 Tax=Candidatus Desulfatifera sulfidica TaxID=2841691 RepID=A0A8J6TCH8_9BACT|nr:hypothetical protein [Candidatus Desulfatifera sulfidica]